MSPTNRPTLHIDWTRCDGRGLCTELVPELLARDQWGYPEPRTHRPSERSDVPVPERHLAAARDAVALCPLVALALHDAP